MSTQQFEDISISDYEGTVNETIHDPQPQVAFKLSKEPPDAWSKILRQFWFGELGSLSEDFIIKDVEVRDGHLLLKLDYETIKRDETPRDGFQDALDEVKRLIRCTNDSYKVRELNAQRRSDALNSMFKQLDYTP